MENSTSLSTYSMYSITHSSSLFYSLRYSIHRVSSFLLAMNVCIRRSCAAQQLGVRGGMHNDGPTSMRGSFHRETYVRESAKRRRCGHWSITGRRGSNRRRCRAISAVQIEFSSNSVTDLGLYVKERIDLIGKTIGPAIQYYRSLSAPTNKMINEVGLPAPCANCILLLLSD